MQAMEGNFFTFKLLKRGEEYAFSHTTPDGTMFASNFTGLPNGDFLTYMPATALQGGYA